jgi:phage gp46-like protein
MDFAISTDNGSPEMTLTVARNGNLLNNLALSFMIPKGEWWYDLSFGFRWDRFRRAKCTPHKEAELVERLKECHQWILDAKRAKSIAYQTERIAGRINFVCTAIGADGVPVTYRNYVEVI